VRVGVYALAKNEVGHVAAWAESCREADVRIVTDTGSTDGTPEALQAAGVEVARGYVCPWRWDEAHNLSLHHLPPDCDIAIRLDLDERLQPGWREAVEAAWTDGVNNLRYRYVWSWRPDGRPDLVFYCDRVHARHGYRWTGATHEGLVRWNGDKVVAVVESGLEIHHFRTPGKKHTTDLELLRVAVREAPHDPRPRWYLAREMDYAGMPEAVPEFTAYLDMPDGQPTERAYACRRLAKLTGDDKWFHRAAKEATWEPDGWVGIALTHYRDARWRECLAFAEVALGADGPPTHATDPKAKTKALDLAAVAAWNLGKKPHALKLARDAAAQCPGDERLRRNVESIERILATADA